MSRRPLALALAVAALLPASAFAEDLLQTYELARGGDPQFAAAESGRLAQKENAVQARAQLLPQIGASARLTRSRGESSGRQVFGGEPLPPNDSESDSTSREYGIDVSQSIFDWSRISTLRSQRALSRAADFDLAAASDSLATRTSAAYFNALVAIETLAAAEAAEAALKRQFDYADKRLEVGLAPITDVHEARAQYDSARANTIVQRNALKDAYQALAEITGTPITDLRGLPEDFQPQLPASQGVDEWVAAAVAQNPTLQSLEQQLQSAEADIGTARGGRLPTLVLSGGYSEGKSWGDSTDFIDDSVTDFENESSGPSVSLVLDVPIFAGGAIRSRVRQAVARRDIAQAQYIQQKRAIERNTRDAYQTLVAGISEVEARRLAVVSAKAAYDASQVGLEVGTRTVLDVLINQQNLFNARQQYALAKYNYLQNRLLLEQAAGSLDVEDVQEINRLLTENAEAQLSSESATQPLQ